MPPDAPPCPVTGLPPRRLVQPVNPRFLAELWRIEFGVDVRPCFGTTDRIDLWESPTGLHYFDPPLVGGTAFYRDYYATLRRRGLYKPDQIRREFTVAAGHVRPGDRVLDVGCGSGGFRLVVPQARYLGLDPHLEADWIRNESLAEHLRAERGGYDVVCAFQVIEHVADPVALFGEMVAATRPGGLVIAGVPPVPSALARIPNFLVNAPPHHVTWWTAAALEALAARCGLAVVTVEAVPFGETDSFLYWTERCSPIRARAVHYRHSWAWHASAAIGYAGGLLLDRLFGPPREMADEGAALLLVARVPG